MSWSCGVAGRRDFLRILQFVIDSNFSTNVNGIYKYIPIQYIYEACPRFHHSEDISSILHMYVHMQHISLYARLVYCTYIC